MSSNFDVVTTIEEDFAPIIKGVSYLPATTIIQAITQITEPQQIAKIFLQTSAFENVVKMVGESREMQNRAALAAIMARIRAVEIYDKLVDDPGGRPKNSSMAIDEFSAKQQMMADMGYSKTSGFRIANEWRRVKEWAGPNYDALLDYFDTCMAEPDGEVQFSRARQIAKAQIGQEDIRWKTSESNEWYTPREYTDAAKAVMGGIDLDPASHDNADTFINAGVYFTSDDDGLSQDWFGCVWLNPPYGKDAKGESVTSKWIDKLLAEYEADRVEQSIFLVNILQSRSQSVQWFISYMEATFCITDHYIRFWASNQLGIGKRAPTNSLFVYAGTEPDRFAEEFSQFGLIARAI